MKDLNEIKLKENETIEILISKDSYIEIEKLSSGTVFIDIQHHNTKAINKVKMDKYVSYDHSEEVSWSKCGSTFRGEGQLINVNHTAYDR